jgi:PAS domain S-box-containing protein
MKKPAIVNIQSTLEKHHDAIVRKWVQMCKEVSPRYSARPTGELFGTISELAQANFEALTLGDFSRLNAIIEHVGTLREKLGFSLPEVQKALELYRAVLLPIVEKEVKGKAVFRVLERLNDCLAFTINRLSEYFQDIHEQSMRDYARNLEAVVEMRTRELAESECKYRQLVEEIRDGYFVSQRGKIVFANQAFCDMHGYKMEEVIGREYTDFVAAQSLHEVKRFFQEKIDGPSGGQYVYFRLGRAGSSFPTENKVTRTYYQGETASIGICRDITERMEIEKRVREAEQLAHIGQLAASLAHEIRNPLSSAKMSIQDLLKSLSLAGYDKRRLELLAKEVARVDRLVTEMLDFAKPIKFIFRPVAIRPFINDCLEVVDAKIGEKKARIRKSLAANAASILLDRERMEQAVINVLLNSIEAVVEGGEITISATSSEENLRIEISDNGAGIREKDLPYIFDPFFSRKRKGTGLGLANAKKVIEAHGGTIGAQPLASGGTCVSINIPITR